MLIRVAVPVPGLDLLTYDVPGALGEPAVGVRVVVPVGTRHVTGVVVDVDAASHDLAGRTAKPVMRVLDASPFVPSDVVALAHWAADYYASGVGDAVTALLPPLTRAARVDAHRTQAVVSLTEAGRQILTVVPPASERPNPDARRRQALAIIGEGGESALLADLQRRGLSRDRVARLHTAGLVQVTQARVARDPFPSAVGPGGVAPPTVPRALTAAQQSAVNRLTRLFDAHAFRVALLHGVTGSGKTEVYLRLAAHARQAGTRVIMLVPEIALTPALAAACRDVFGSRVAIQHSGLSDGERHDQWHRIRDGHVDVVVGTRSAVFAPVPQLGLVIVDEEHDPSYKQDDSPRYHGRDVAIVRAQRAGALVVLGSATPSMETYANALSGRYERIVLAERVLDRPLAHVTLVDMREVYAAEGPEAVLSPALRTALAQRLDAGEQSLVLLNRRGFATSVFCRQCGDTVNCPNCAVSLVVHGDGPSRRARCHYCNYSVRVPSTCPSCAAPYLVQTGFGTERVELEVQRACPTARVGRVDRDAVRRKGALVEVLSNFRRQTLDILVGTQMIAKGHDFPSVTLVGVISADVGLGMADFRASERTFQLLTQVAGRAGRGERPGEAIVQTIYPDHYAVQMACRQDFTAFYDKELVFRKAMRYPPQVALINIVVRGRQFASTFADAERIVRELRKKVGTGETRVLGPAPAPLGRLRGEYRVQLLIKGTHRRDMRAALVDVLRTMPEVARRASVDVDPVSVL